MDEPEKQYWFRAKRYGWGWGAPTCWQGWAVLGAYLAVVLGAGQVMPVERSHFVVLGATVILLAICWRKGEPTRWRWGRK
jgi:hypothetical protein